jgi:hypothetical protein
MKGTSLAPSPGWREPALFLLFFGVTALLQFLSGAYHSEFAGYPDESAHYVTGLMVRDYIAGLHYDDPMGFASDYYAHYPKVALGHWPPLLYMVEGLWMLVFSPARASVLLQMAFLTSLVAWLTYSTVKRHFGWRNGIFAGLLLICLPIVQIYSDEIMAESLLTLVTFAAVICFARYLESRRWQDSALFGLFASLAILTKGSGWDLALVPPIALLLMRNFQVLRTWVFWLPALIVAALCAPWQLMTMTLVQRGWQGGDKPSLDYTFDALRRFALILFDLLGWGLAPLILIGLTVTVIAPFIRNRIQAEWAAMAALIVSAVLFHAVVPAGVESRKLIIAVPALILFLFAGGEWLIQRFRWNPSIVLIVAATVFGIQKFSIPAEIHYGYSEAARFIRDRRDPRDLVVLVSSERDGEGMLVSELAMSEKRPTHRILRATKFLANTDWNGNVSQTYYKSPEDLLAYLKSHDVGLVVSDTLPHSISFEYQRVLNETIARYPDRLKLIGTFRGDLKGAINVYRVAQQ